MHEYFLRRYQGAVDVTNRWCESVSRYRVLFSIKLLLAAAVALGITLALVPDGVPHFSAHLLRAGIPVIVLWFALWLIGRRRGQVLSQRQRSVTVIVAGLFVYLCSGAAEARWFFFLDWIGPGPTLPVPLWGVCAWLVVVVAVVLTWRPGIVRWAIPTMLFLGVAWAGYRFDVGTNGATLYRDDHASFLYRIWVFTQCFPEIRNYLPYWNAGVVDTAGLSSGIHGLCQIWWPLLLWFPVEQVYNGILSCTFLVLVPLFTLLALRACGLDWHECAVGGILSVGVSQHFFLWLLHYGTPGASLTMASLAFVTPLLLGATWLKRPGAALGVALVPAAYLTVHWPPGALLMILLGLGVIFSWKRWTVQRWVFYATCGAAVLLLFLRPICVLLFWDDTLAINVTSTDANAVSVWSSAGMLEAWNLLRAHVVEFNPLLIFLGLAGLVLAAPRPVRIFFAPIVVGMMLLTAFGPELQPRLQLSRMAIPLAFVLVTPASVVASRLLRDRHPATAVPRALVLVLLAATLWNSARLYGNEGRAKYTTFDQCGETIVNWIKGLEPRDGRVLFAGSTVHGICCGHVAYLPILTGREMMACDYFHFPPYSVDYEYPPYAYLKDADTIFRFFDMNNVTHVITFRDPWKNFFATQPERIEKVQEMDDVVLYRVVRKPNWFELGRGSVCAQPNRIDVDLDDAEAEAVLRYNWDDGLGSLPPAEVFPVTVDEHTRFIGIRPHGEKHVSIVFSPRT